MPTARLKIDEISLLMKILSEQDSKYKVKIIIKNEDLEKALAKLTVLFDSDTDLTDTEMGLNGALSQALEKEEEDLGLIHYEMKRFDYFQEEAKNAVIRLRKMIQNP